MWVRKRWGFETTQQESRRAGLYASINPARTRENSLDRREECDRDRENRLPLFDVLWNSCAFVRKFREVALSAIAPEK
jgi:hypothetical protein